MATSGNSRDVKLTLGVETTGADGVAKLKTEFSGLAAEGKTIAGTFDGSASSAAKLQTELESLTAAVKQQRAAETAAQADTKAAKNALEAQRETLARLRIEYATAGGDAAKYKADVLQLRTAILDSRGALREKTEALATATAGAAKAANAEQGLIVQIKAATDAEQRMAAAAKSSAEAQVAGTTRAATSLKTVTEESGRATQSGSVLGETFSKLGPILAAAFSGRKFIDTITQAEALERGLKAVTGTTAGAGAEMEYLRTTSNRLGLELMGTGKAYLSLAAATKGTAIEGQKTKDVFEAVSRAGSVLGKSSEEVGRALTAVQQMASKGTVSMEELRGQLGEALPGAMAAAAKGAGLTTAELIQMVSAGDVLAVDLLPALTKGLNELYGSAPPEGIISNWNRLTNVITQASIAMGKGGAAGGLTDLAGGAAVALTQLSEGVGLASGGLSDFATVIRTGSLDEFQFSERLKESKERIAKVGEAAGFAVPEIKGLGTAAATAGAVTQESFRKSEIAARNAGDGMQESALKQRAAFAELERAAERRLDQSKKAADAADAEAKVITMIAAAFGTETDKMTANTMAANLQRDAQVKLAEARKAELAIVEQKLTALAKEMAAAEKFSPEMEEQRKKLVALIATKKEEVRSTEASAKAQEVAAAAARVATEAYKDNSARLGQLKAAYDDTTRAVEELRAQQLQGKATGKEVDAAVLKHAEAQKLYADALRDTVTAAEIHEKVIARTAATRAKESDLNIEAARTTLELAKARGDEAAATTAQTTLTNIETEVRRQAVQAIRDEAGAMRATADALEREAKATGALTTEKKEQIAAIRSSADQKDLDARKSEILAEREYALARATSTGAAAFINALEQKVAAQEKYNAVIERANALEDKRRGVDKDGFAANKDGSRLTMGGDLTTRTGVYNFLKSAGVTDEKVAKDITNEFADSRGNIEYFGNKGQKKYGGDSSTISEALLKAAERFTFSEKSMQSKAGAAPSQGSTTHTVTFNLPGSNKSVNMASAADAAALTGILRQFESASGAAS